MRTASASLLILSSVAVAGCSGGGGGGGGGGTPKTPVGFCSVDQWCFVNPIPQGESLNSVWVLPDGTAFAAGNDGEALRYSAGAWSEINVPSGSIDAIRAFDDSHAIAVGYDGVYWWDGTTWTQDGTFPNYGADAIWAASDTDVWVVDQSGNADQWNGSTWSMETIPPIGGSVAAITGKSDTDLWAAGANGIAHRTGPAAWATTNLGSYVYFQAMAEVAPNDVWAGTEDAGIYHDDGTGWSVVDSSPYYVTGMFAVDATHVYAAAEDPGLLMWNGSTWGAIGGTGYGGIYDLTAVGMRSASDGWAVGYEGKLVQIGGTSAKQISSDIAGGGTISSLSVVSANEIWAGDENSNDLFRWDGSRWNDYNMPIDSPQGVYAAGHDDVYAGSNYGGAIAHYDGTGWTTQVASGPTVEAMWGTGHSDVYAVGPAGYLTHYDGNQWTQVAAGVTSNGLFGLGGSGSGDVYAVGQQGTILHGGGATWTKIDAGLATPADLYGVWAASATDVFIVGDGVILHGNASGGWTPETLPAADSYVYWRAIWGTSTTDIWAASEEGLLLHKDATGWTEKKSPTRLGLTSIAGVGKDVWASGASGAVLRYRAP